MSSSFPPPRAAPNTRLYALAVGVIVLGLSAGLLLLVPLVDVVNRRRLIGGTLVLQVCALFAAAVARGPVAFLVAAFASGHFTHRRKTGRSRAEPRRVHLLSHHGSGRPLLAMVACQWVLARSMSLALLVVSAVVLDLGVIGDQALGRRAINMLDAQARGRLNGLFTGLFFAGGALGAMITGPAWSYWDGRMSAQRPSRSRFLRWRCTGSNRRRPADR